MCWPASGDSFSAAHTRSIVEAVAKTIYPAISPAAVERIHFLIRKAAHLSEYAILAGLLFHAFRGGLPSGWQVKWARRSLGVCLAVAAIDEFHQGLVPSRTSSPWDVLLDAAGALLMLWLIRMGRRTRQQEPCEELVSSNS